jgi:hypothetical protein
MKKLSFDTLFSLAGGVPFEPYAISYTVSENDALTVANGVFLSYQEDGVFTLSSIGGVASMVVSGTLPNKGDHMDVDIVSGVGESMALRLTRRRGRLTVSGTISPPLPPS